MLQEKLQLLLDKYAVAASAKLCEKDGEPAVEIDGTVYPILAHRFERRFTELRKMLGDGTLTGLSAVRGGNVQLLDFGILMKSKKLWVKEFSLPTLKKNSLA